jgi:hypothetical protein
MDTSVEHPDGTHPTSPVQRYVEWFNGIWHTGDPATWNADVFTNDAVMIDPTGITRGADQAAGGFTRLFDYYPELRGEVVSWAANDRELMINWRFEVVRGKGAAPQLVPVLDKFCFVDGRVSFRLAYFDLVSLASYLSERFGQDHLLDYLGASSRNAMSTGGIQNLPRTIWNLIRGAFRWLPSPTPSGLTAFTADQLITLRWPHVKDATYYRVCRADSIGGTYDPISGQVFPRVHELPYVSFDDHTVENGESYWYTVTPFFGSWQPVQVRKTPPRHGGRAGVTGHARV